MGASTLSDVERAIAGRAARAGLRLRFNRVALRVVATLRYGLTTAVPAGEAILFTITAPVRLPGKAISGIETLARGLSAGERISDAVHGNDVRLRRIRGVDAHAPRVVGLVHSPGSDADLLLDLAEAQLTGAEDVQAA